jgi:putative toxin-antitoxin system antitoxin component (TIGR02293 family)
MTIEKAKSPASRGMKGETRAALKQAAIEAARRAGHGPYAKLEPQDPVLLALTKSPGLIRHPKDFFVHVYMAKPMDRVSTVKAGIVFRVLDAVAVAMGTRPNILVEALGIGRSTIARKKKTGSRLGKDQSERLMGVASLIGRIQATVNEQGNQQDFDAARWFKNWSEQSIPALGGRRPSELLDTMEGQQIVANLLDAIRGGTYL